MWRRIFLLDSQEANDFTRVSGIWDEQYGLGTLFFR
jgi:hypothetical protein